MNSNENKLEKIIERIRNDANSKIEKINKETEQKISETKANMEKSSEKERKKILLKGEKEIENTKSQILSLARLKNKKIINNSWDALLEKVYEQSLKALENISDTDYMNYIKTMIGKSQLLLGSDIDVYCNTNDIELVKKITTLISPNVHVISDDQIKSKGGVIIKTKDGNKSIDVTLEKKLDNIWDENRAKVLEILIQGGK